MGVSLCLSPVLTINFFFALSANLFVAQNGGQGPGNHFGMPKIGMSVDHIPSGKLT